MAGYNGVPTIRKRLIGSQLRRLREERELSVESVAEQLAIGPSSLRRQEYGQTAVSVADVIAYARIYKLDEDGPVVQRLLDLAKHGRTRGWWTAYDTTVGPSAADIADAEDLATSIKTWQPNIIPGLLQTREYSATIIGTRQVLKPGPVDQVIELRERRKEVLARTPNPPQLWAIIGEGAILAEIGGRALMNEQLQHLLNQSQRPHVAIQIMPFKAGAHLGLDGGFMVMGFDATLDGGIAYMENGGSGVFSDDPAEVRSHADRFSHMQAQALTTADTRTYLLSAISAK
jgi:transcriptional regulator with XRE-family HTH domain